MGRVAVTLEGPFTLQIPPPWISNTPFQGLQLLWVSTSPATSVPKPHRGPARAEHPPGALRRGLPGARPAPSPAQPALTSLQKVTMFSHSALASPSSVCLLFSTCMLSLLLRALRPLRWAT